MVCDEPNDDIVPTFTVIDSGSQKGKPKLVDSNGYCYVKKSSTQNKVYWRCSVRNTKQRCGASVVQNVNTESFVNGKAAHNHPCQPGKLHAVVVRKEVKEEAMQNVFKSARAIYEEIADQNLVDTQPASSRENPENLVRAANRIREKSRPKDPKNLDFIVNEEAIPEDFYRGDVHVKGERHLIFASDSQLHQLSMSRQWFVDGTFKIVKKPFHQLLSIHGFVKAGRQMKMVPLCFVLMSRRRKMDYIKVLRKLLTIIEPPNLKTVVMDFEAASWMAFERVMPEVKVRGCLFHFTQAIWRRCQELGLQNMYRSHGQTSSLVRKLMSLPFLPKSHIEDVFRQLQTKTENPLLMKLLEYMDRQWISHSIFTISSWSVFNQTIRTNNHVEGWHRRINHKSGENQLGLYRLVNFLHSEAAIVPLQRMLLLEGKLRRYLIKSGTRAQEEIFEAWAEYKNKDISVNSLLRICSKVHGPTE